MKDNRYDDAAFFEKYAGMDRSQKGLAGAGEWPALEKMLPDFTAKRVLDLGCGYGWHCRYAAEKGAASVLGLDLSQKMLDVAAQKNAGANIAYHCGAIEDVDLPPEGFDIVLSSLALHYVASFPVVCEKVYGLLAPGGHFVFSVEHPIFTAYGSQDWLYDDSGKKLCWPVDRYFTEGERTAVFLGEEVRKYHKTLTTYLGGLLRAGFAITDVVEPTPGEELLRTVPSMEDELRRPMMLLVASQKQE